MQYDWTTFVLEIINFLVLVWLLKHFLYRPVMGAIARRQASVEQSIAEAQTREQEARALKTEYENRLVSWEAEKQKAGAALQAELEAEHGRRIYALDAEIQTERARRQALAEHQEEERRRAAEEEAVVQGGRFVARLLARLASPEIDARLADLFIEDLQRLPEAQRQALRTALTEDSGPAIRVMSAFPLAEERQGAIRRALAELAGRDLPCAFAVDGSLLAGVQASLGSWVLSADLRDELRFFTEVAPHGSD
jgi:F-type H+-transporting ATPase subunit b